jgi:hypothetical protein
MKVFYFLYLLLVFTVQSTFAINHNWEITKIEEIENNSSHITFSEVNPTKRTVTMVDDDGMASLACIHFNLLQEYSKKLFMNANIKWDTLKDTNVDAFIKFKAEILKSIKRLISYDSNLIIELEKKLNTSRDKKPIQDQIKIFTNEMNQANALYYFLQDKDKITVGDLSENMGNFIERFHNLHEYKNYYEGTSTTETLLGENTSNPIGMLLKSRPLVLSDNIYMSKSSSNLTFSTDAMRMISGNQDTSPKPRAIKPH